MMENEELLAGDPDVAQLHTQETRTGDVNENTPLIDESGSLLHQQPVYATDSRPKWRKPSVSDYGLRQQRQEQLSNLQNDRFGGCFPLVSSLPWALVELLCPRST